MVLINIKSFSIIGGDKRQLSMAQSILKDGNKVCISCFEKIKDKYPELENKTVDNALFESEYIIFPISITKDFININVPFSDDNISINDDLIEILKNKIIFCGMSERLIKINENFKNLIIKDFSKREEFNICNAIPTAEGAIEIAMKEYQGTIHGSKCLVTGFGRIGKVLSCMLKGLGAEVYVNARNPKDISWINLMGYQSILTQEIAVTNRYNIIFNTIPKMIFNSNTLAKTSQNSILIDLASAPGGVDFESANKLGIKAIQALSLPGKVAPITAGEIIKKTIYSMIKEDSV